MLALKSLARLLQILLATTAIVLFLTWLFLFIWELFYHQILIDDYLSGFLAWVLILLLIRKLIGSLMARGATDPAAADDREPQR